MGEKRHRVSNHSRPVAAGGSAASICHGGDQHDLPLPRTQSLNLAISVLQCGESEQRKVGGAKTTHPIIQDEVDGETVQPSRPPRVCPPEGPEQEVQGQKI